MENKPGSGPFSSRGPPDDLPQKLSGAGGEYFLSTSLSSVDLTGSRTPVPGVHNPGPRVLTLSQKMSHYHFPRPSSAIYHDIS